MNVGVFVAHPDDEVIGIGGTLIKHILCGDQVSIYILAEGKSSREESYDVFSKQILESFRNETINAVNIMGIKEENVHFLDLPNNRLDKIDLLDIIKIIERIEAKEKFDVIYTHNGRDLNIDHEIVARAVITAFRALPGQSVKEILMFETLSSTESGMALGRYFEPNLFVDISDVLDKKSCAMNCYKSELREKPHPRNIELIENNAIVWGSKVGVRAAEAFKVARILR